MGLRPSSARIAGSAKFEGVELLGMSDTGQHRAARAGRLRRTMVFQDPARSLNPTMRIGIQITEAIRSHFDVSRADAKKQAVELLQMVRLPSAEQRFSEYPCTSFSGGMRQRVMICDRASHATAKLLIADEATTALDAHHPGTPDHGAVAEDLADRIEHGADPDRQSRHGAWLRRSPTRSSSCTPVASRRARRRRPSSSMERADALYKGPPPTRSQVLEEQVPHLAPGDGTRSAAGPDRVAAGLIRSGCCRLYVQDDWQGDRTATPRARRPNHIWACFHPVNEGSTTQ